MNHLLFIIKIFRHYALNELYKVYHKLPRTIFSELFTRNNSTYNLRSKSDFVIPQMNTVFKGSNSISYCCPIMLSLVPEKIRSKDSLESFKYKIRKYKPRDCPCRTSKNYIQMLDFYKHLNSIFRKKEILFIFASFELGIKRISLTAALLSF